jgi:protein TonB
VRPVLHRESDAVALADSAAGGALDAWAGVRRILVPPDIVAVARRSPPRVRKKTPWRPQPDGAVRTDRTGAREWFSDHLFVETQDGHRGIGYSASLTTHAVATIALLVFLMTRPAPVVIPPVIHSLVMPTFAPHLVVPEARVAQSPSPAKQPETPGVAAPRKVALSLPPPPAVAAAPAPIAAPSSVTPETGAERTVGPAADISEPGGVVGGTPGGVIGGVIGAAPTGNGQPGAPGQIVRVGAEIKAPRKIKDARPIFPETALSGRAQGVVLIEAVIGPDGKVREAKVVHSVAPFDGAALDAVRQWEYEPSLLNGVVVSIVMTVAVRFSLQ